MDVYYNNKKDNDNNNTNNQPSLTTKIAKMQPNEQIWERLKNGVHIYYKL